MGRKFYRDPDTNEKVYIDEEVKEKRKFYKDPDSGEKIYIDSIEEKPVEETPLDKIAESAKAFGRGVGQSAFGLGDEIYAGSQTGGEELKGLLGGKKLSNLKDLINRYDKNVGTEREAVKKAYEEHPVAAYGGEIGASVIPGIGQVGKLGRVGKLLKAYDKIQNINPVQSGMISGYGTSESKDPLQLGEDIFEGGAVGGGVGTVLKNVNIGDILPGAIKQSTALAGKSLFDVPMKGTRKYIEQGPKILENFRTPEELALHLDRDIVPKFSEDIRKGSKESREVLKKHNIKDSDISNLLQPEIDEIEKFTGGKELGLPQEDALDYLKHLQSQYKPKKVESSLVGPSGNKIINEVDQDLNLEKAKNILQALSGNINWEKKPGHIARPDDAILKSVRNKIKKFIVDKEPEFEKIMKQVDEDARLLNDTKKLGNPTTVRNIFKRVGEDKEGSIIPREILERIDKNRGTNLVEEAEGAMLKDLYQRDRTKGSKQTNKWIGLLGPKVGGIVGTLADEYGGKVVKTAADTAIKINEAGKQGKGIYGKMIKALDSDVAKGSTQAFVTRQILKELNKEERND